MALLNILHLDTLISIEIKIGRKYESIATGFLIGFIRKNSKDPQKRIYNIFLITNRHVFENKEEVFFRFNKNKGGSVRFRVDLIINRQTKWLAHINKKIDLALLTVPIELLKQNNIDWRFFNEEMFAEPLKFRKIGIELGDDIFAIGFPLGLSGNLQNFPIVRSGSIARINKETLKNNKAFMVDASIFPGNSGGPVLLKPAGISLKNSIAVKRIYLLGVVSGYLSYKEVLYTHQTDPPSYAGVSVENSGLAFVVPMNYAKQIYRKWLITKKQLEKSHKGIERSLQQ